jgi:FSR family fosmidomycin resistance protein-like MFS transporter
VLSFHGMGGNVGEAIAPVVVGAMLGWLSWRSVVVINVVPGLLMAMLILTMLGAFSAAKSSEDDGINAGGEKRSVKDYLRDFASLLRNRALMIVSVSSAFRTMTQAGLLTFLPVYLAYELGYSPLYVGVCMTLVQVGGFIAAPIAGHLSDKMGRKRVVMSSMVLTGLMLIGMVLAGKTIAFVIFVALVGFFLYGMRSVLQAWAVESTPRHLAGTGVGVQFGVTALGASVAPIVFGAIADATDVYMGFYFLAGTIIFANLLVFFMPNTDAPKVAVAEARS